MKNTILVAGATGNLGSKIVDALISRGAEVRALARPSSDDAKLKALAAKGVKVFLSEMDDKDSLIAAFTGVDTVVSALQGLREVIVDTQKSLLDAAVEAGVPRFIPSDFSTDFTELADGDNRNFDLRREFHQYLDKAPIASTSIFNGAFAYVISMGTPLLDQKNLTIGYWEDADWAYDATTVENTAEFTAAVALDSSAPKKLHIAGMRINAQQVKSVVEELTGKTFELKHLGSRVAFTGTIRQMRSADPDGEKELYPQWQGMQYLLSMFTVPAQPLDNDRYPDIHWTNAKEFLKSQVL
ncbi:NmrA family NAD(P)-binding protein [Mucilaginibacter gilvus]|uniref:NAD-dependent epimerase/dehydratase family protein n=1 Tax=Mucilaginibacter gilvus TaxID=2305909 RepID=A0A444MI84_9SPHI|nr:NmrA family NAD(P)-binding protein [Mucilaginibacter gilvus]RWY47371.1 NAD-dependent epimerase/dehydratase family protein [Mucilaginibacter gilvus]